MYQDLSPAEYQRLQETAEQVALQLRRQAQHHAQDALYRSAVKLWRASWRLEVRLLRHGSLRTASRTLGTGG